MCVFNNVSVYRLGGCQHELETYTLSSYQANFLCSNKYLAVLYLEKFRRGGGGANWKKILGVIDKN